MVANEERDPQMFLQDKAEIRSLGDILDDIVSKKNQLVKMLLV